jgi:CRP-like cAMP-binding protein
MTKSIQALLKQHRFLEDLPDSDLELLAGCGKNIVAKSGTFIAHEGGPADFFYLIRRGKVAIEARGPGHEVAVLETLGEGDVLGWSWLFPPHRWTFDFHAREDTHLVAMDAMCLRGKAEADPAFGYRLMKSFSRVMTERLRAARMQILDVYANKGRSRRRNDHA